MNHFKSVYIVDDDVVFHLIMKKLFQKTNLKLSTNYFKNGLEALEKLKSQNSDTDEIPDLILLDINMPICDGWQFLEEFKNISESVKNRIKIYLVSSSDNEADISKSKHYQGIVEKYYFKPMTVQNFESIFVN
ncbi:MAG: CheY-like chemotaxis protein [Flavobacterium sp.]|jgi:CheY-like chemotaxis protein